MSYELHFLNQNKSVYVEKISRHTILLLKDYQLFESIANGQASKTQRNILIQKFYSEKGENAELAALFFLLVQFQSFESKIIEV